MDRTDVYIQKDDASEPVLSHIELTVDEEELKMLDDALVALGGLLRSNQYVVRGALIDAQDTDLELIARAHEKLDLPVGVLAELRKEPNE